VARLPRVSAAISNDCQMRLLDVGHGITAMNAMVRLNTYPRRNVGISTSIPGRSDSKAISSALIVSLH
jgi:hypothetical protein